MRELSLSERDYFEREWTIENRCGVSASGTIAGLRSRRRHGLLLAPVAGECRMFWQAIEEEIEREQLYLLSTGEWRGGILDPRGFSHIERYFEEQGLPIWHYRVEDALLEKRIWLAADQQTSYVQYQLLEAQRPLALILRIYANSRPATALTRGDSRHLFDVEMLDAETLRIAGGPDEAHWFLLSLPPVTSYPELRWSWGAYYRAEAAKVMPAEEDLFRICSFHTLLSPGDQHTLVGTREPPELVDRDPERSLAFALEMRRRAAR